MLDSAKSSWDDGPNGAITLMELLNIFDHQMAISRLMLMRTQLSSERSESTVVSAEVRKDIHATLEGLAAESERLSIDACSDLIRYAQHECSGDNAAFHTVGRLAAKLTDIDIVFKTQCNRQIFFRLNREDSAMFSLDAPFGADVAKAFPSDETVYEITEANKSFCQT